MKITPDKHAGYLCQKALYKRGWTPAMIREAGLFPEAYTDNPHGYPSKQNLFSTAQVVAIERTDWFFDRLRKAKARGKARKTNRSNPTASRN